MLKQLFNNTWETNLHNKATKLGRDEGAKGRPTEDTDPFDPAETSIRNDINKKIIELETICKTEIENIHPKLTQYENGFNQQSVNFANRLESSNLYIALDNILNHERNNLTQAIFKRISTEGPYNSFRLSNNIKITEPDNPKDLLDYFSTILIIWAIETVLNSVFWTNTFSGWVGKGLIVSLLLSGLNILIGLFAGYLFSYKNLANSKSKYIAYIGFISFIILDIFLNLFIINRRAVLETNGTNDIIFSVIMFSVGLAFCLFSSMKGYRVLGSIPGYMTIAKEYTKAVDEITNLNNKLLHSVTKKVNDEKDLRLSILRHFQDSKVALKKLSGLFSNIKFHYINNLNHLSVILQRCVNAYRQNNISVKPKGVKSPDWFNDPINKYEMDNSIFDEIERKIDILTTEIDEFINHYTSIISNESLELTNLLTQYINLNFKDFLNNCEINALQKYNTQNIGIGNKGKTSF